MPFVADVRRSVPRQGRTERAQPDATGVNEDAASGPSGVRRRLNLDFAEPS